MSISIIRTRARAQRSGARNRFLNHIFKIVIPLPRTVGNRGPLLSADWLTHHGRISWSPLTGR